MKTSIKISQIPDLSYQGYYWYSDQTKPEVVLNEKISSDIFTDLPFIIEGNLYAPAQKISIQIKNIDGEYKIFKADLNNVAEEPQAYFAHDIDGFTKYQMIEAWEEAQLGAGVKTLRPAWSAFAGFIK